ncbi:cupin domain-containing protein [Lusitaniella coriacea LEGE 07157]|uniref:Cupin domain-containing protein n=1 Tax=Lusitaniella coriacea LEGE 07157 TaxID=945747 RepID=A0A8J7AXI0_9CYAN|nr:cupin domain-containing protein [Lusitaniella coriacea]MBE9114494.1 cupin domain-containing protein [Lusitaniella coriacea LEGE 07157]
MTEEDRSLLKAETIENTPEFAFHHPLNPNSEIHLRSLSRATNLQRVGVSLSRVPPGKESFIYHTHRHEEEWIYILSGRGIAEIGDREFEVGPGDFMGFVADSLPHHLRNPFEEDLKYLMGGENLPCDIGAFPRLGKRVIRDGDASYLVDDADFHDFCKE